MNKIDQAGIAFGFMLALSAWIRFFIHGSDLGETFLAGILGITIMIVFLMHHNQTKLKVIVDIVEEKLQDIKNELKPEDELEWESIVD